MTDTKKPPNKKELRKFVRLKWQYPVEFTIISFGEDLPGIGWQQGMTQNVSAEGMSLEAVDVHPITLEYLQKHDIYLKLQLNIPTTEMPVKATGEVVWHHPDNEGGFTVGLRFKTMADEDLKRILRHAHWKMFVQRIFIFIGLFIVGLGVYLLIRP